MFFAASVFALIVTRANLLSEGTVLELQFTVHTPSPSVLGFYNLEIIEGWGPNTHTHNYQMQDHSQYGNAYIGYMR